MFLFFSCVPTGKLITKRMNGRNSTLTRRKQRSLWPSISPGLEPINLAVNLIKERFSNNRSEMFSLENNYEYKRDMVNLCLFFY